MSISGTDETFSFTYEPVSEITGVSPNFIFSEDDIIILITGNNFFFEDTSLTKVILTSQDLEIIKTPLSVTSSEIQVQYEANDFAPRTRVEVSVTFNGEEYYDAPQFISVSERFNLERLSQEIISSSAETILIHINEETESQGGVWDTQENLKCSYNSGTYLEKATYISSTLVQ